MTAAHDLLGEARAQLAYIDERFPTGTTPAVIARLDVALSAPLSSRLDALLDEARALSIDLRTARDAAPDGGKAGYRLANQRVEQAIAKLAQAAEVKL